MENNAKNLYDLTAHSYDSRHDNDTTRHMRRREAGVLAKHARGLVLDIGCGTGAHAKMFEKYIGADMSRKMVLEASKKNKKQYIIANAESLPFASSSFDSVICMFTVLNLCDAKRAAKEMSSVLKAGGTAVVSVASVWDRKNYGMWSKLRGRPDADAKNVRIEKNRLAFKLFTKRGLIKIFENTGFRLQEFHGIYKWQEPYWNRYASFGIAARAKLLLENILPSQTGRIYIAAFRKI